MNRRKFLQTGLALGAASAAVEPAVLALQTQEPSSDRDYWIQNLTRIADPLLHALAEGRLRTSMPVEAPHGNIEDRKQFTYLEGFARLLCGIAPWLELGADESVEGRLRNRYGLLARKALQLAVDPASPDHMNFKKGEQPVVDSAFLVLAILRAPNTLWKDLDGTTQKHLIAALESSRVIRPGYNNWLLFSGIIEAGLAAMGAWWDPMRIDYAVRTIDTWYKGDGVYGDGPSYHSDYYNSFVIHPLLLQTLETIAPFSAAWNGFHESVHRRAVRYAAIQERLISPEATFPPIGRSLCYRFGAFHLLADIARRRQLPAPVQPAQVRSALTAVMHRMLNAPGTFDANGWLTVGFFGHQPSVAESYISTGSTYLCSAAWLPLGLPASDAFWSAPALPWTSKQAWSGQPVMLDHALNDGAAPNRTGHEI